MKGSKIYNLVWLCLWVLCGAGAVCGVIAGNPAHWIIVCACIYFSYCHITDKDTGGESLGDVAARILRERNGKKK